MPFLLAMDLSIGSQVPFRMNPQLPLDPIQLAVPLKVDEGSVDASPGAPRLTAAQAARDRASTFSISGARVRTFRSA